MLNFGASKPRVRGGGPGPRGPPPGSAAVISLSRVYGYANNSCRDPHANFITCEKHEFSKESLANYLTIRVLWSLGSAVVFFA